MCKTNTFNVKNTAGAKFACIGSVRVKAEIRSRTWSVFSRKSALSSVNLNTSSVYATALQQKTQSMNTLFSALKAGDLPKAQEAYAASGLPPMGANNTSPLGRLYNALSHEDLKSAQQAALDMQGRKASKSTNAGSTNTTSPTIETDPKAKIKATALELVKQSRAQNNLSALLGLGNHVNTWG